MVGLKRMTQTTYPPTKRLLKRTRKISINKKNSNRSTKKPLPSDTLKSTFIPSFPSLSLLTDITNKKGKHQDNFLPERSPQFFEEERRQTQTAARKEEGEEGERESAKERRIEALEESDAREAQREA